MKKVLAVFALFVVACTCVAAQAQQQTSRTRTDERFNACMNNRNCSTQVRLQIIQEENDEMNNRFQKIHQACADANFRSCVSEQKDNVDAWYKAQNKMQKLMQSIQSRDMKGHVPSAAENGRK